MIEPELLAQLLSNPDQVRERLNALISERAASDGSFGALAQLVMGQNAQTTGDQSTASPSARRIALDRLRSSVADLREELELLSKRNELLASALGACRLCWGTDDDCADCSGGGRSGWRVPNRTHFQKLIAPAIQRLSDEKSLQQEKLQQEKGGES